MANLVDKQKTPENRFAENGIIQEREVFAYFNEYLRFFDTFSSDDLKGLEQYWTVKMVRKNRYLFMEREIVHDFAFVVKGAVKLYRDHDKGYHIFALMTEANFCSMKKKFDQRKPAMYNALCVEDTMMLTIDRENMARLINDRPAFADFFLEQSESIACFLEHRLTAFQLYSAHERYEELLDNSPDLLSRFSLHDIANFLGMKPETLSRIRSVLGNKKDLKIAI